MPNPRLATRYAKALIGLSIERNQLEEVHNDMQYLKSVCAASSDFTAMLRSPVVNGDAKLKVLDAITSGKVNEVTAGFNRLLVTKGREAVLPEIITAFIQQYKEHKSIHTVKLTTALPLSDELKEAIVNKIRTTSDMQNIELEATVKEDIIGGFVLQIGDRLVDASVAYDLKAVKKQFMNNDFIYKIR